MNHVSYPPALSKPTEQVTKELEQLAASIEGDISRVGDEDILSILGDLFPLPLSFPLLLSSAAEKGTMFRNDSHGQRVKPSVNSSSLEMADVTTCRCSLATRESTEEGWPIPTESLCVLVPLLSCDGRSAVEKVRLFLKATMKSGTAASNSGLENLNPMKVSIISSSSAGLSNMSSTNTE